MTASVYAVSAHAAAERSGYGGLIWRQSASAQPAPVQAQPTLNNNSWRIRVSQEAFAKTARQMMPLTPDQIKTLRYLFDQSQKAAAADPGDKPPKPTSSSVMVNLIPRLGASSDSFARRLCDFISIFRFHR